MTDMEYIRMRQDEGRGDRSATRPAPGERSSRRVAALMRLARQTRGQRPGGRLQRQP